MKDFARFTRRGLVLVPADREARELLSCVGEAQSVFMQLWLPRNMKQHRKYFALLSNVVEATGRWTSVEHLRKDVLTALHRYHEEADQFTGEVRKVHESMAVASMPRAEFERLYDDTIRLLTEALGANPEMLQQEAA